MVTKTKVVLPENTRLVMYGFADTYDKDETYMNMFEDLVTAAVEAGDRPVGVYKLVEIGTPVTTPAKCVLKNVNKVK